MEIIFYDGNQVNDKIACGLYYIVIETNKEDSIWRVLCQVLSEQLILKKHHTKCENKRGELLNNLTESYSDK